MLLLAMGVSEVEMQLQPEGRVVSITAAAARKVRERRAAIARATIELQRFIRGLRARLYYRRRSRAATLVQVITWQEYPP